MNWDLRNKLYENLEDIDKVKVQNAETQRLTLITHNNLILMGIFSIGLICFLFTSSWIHLIFGVAFYIVGFIKAFTFNKALNKLDEGILESLYKLANKKRIRDLSKTTSNLFNLAGKIFGDILVEEKPKKRTPRRKTTRRRIKRK